MRQDHEARATEKQLRAQQAKEFLISQILEEAGREGIELSEIERKMLYFTETQATLPDMAGISDAFDEQYSSAAYEKKISTLVKNAFKRARSESSETTASWTTAAGNLQKEDHYLSVMVDAGMEAAARVGENFLAVVASILIIVVGISAAFGWEYLDSRHWLPHWVTRVPAVVWAYGFALAIPVGIAAVNLARKGQLGEFMSGKLSGLSYFFPFSLFRRQNRK
jgi:hypothetical protein